MLFKTLLLLSILLSTIKQMVVIGKECPETSAESGPCGTTRTCLREKSEKGPLVIHPDECSGDGDC